MTDITTQVNRLSLSGDEITQMTKWDDSMVIDYLGIHESLLRVAQAFDSLISFSALPTEDSGDGTIEGDTNATDWTGHAQSDGTRLNIRITDSVIFGHKDIAYQYVGKKPALLGVGGDYTTVNEDFIPIGTGDHTVLVNRDQPDSHPILAITDLQDTLNSLNISIGSLETRMTSAESRLDTVETLIIELTVSGYGGAIQDTDVALTIPTVTYNTLPVDTPQPLVQRGVSFNLGTEQFTFTQTGVWTAMIFFSLAGHNSSNGGRVFTMRLRNVTQGTFGDGVVIGVGRNVEDTFASVSYLFDITQANVDNGDSFLVEVGNADTAITGGTLVAGGIQVTLNSELGSLI